MAKTLCKILGVVLLIVGLVGFASPNLLGMHLTPIHNIVHLVTAAIALYLGFAGSPEGAKTFCAVFGAIYLLLGILGFAAPGVVASIIGHPGPVTSADLTPDNAVHLLLGIVFLAAGLGGGTGSGAGPVIAKLAAESGALTVAVVTKPFDFEGKKRMRQAERAARELREHVDTLITIPNQRLLSFVERNTPFNESFKIADDVLRQAIQGIADLINCPGEINRDFADVKKIMSDMGRAMMGTAVAEGENRAVHAAQAAISSPLLEDASIEGARGVLINVTGSADLTLFEVNEAAEIIRQAADPEAIILFGYVNDDRMAGSVKVTVIATGFDRADAAMEEKEEEESRYVAQRGGRTPFLRGDDTGGFGPNASASRDDFDIPTVLRRQMD